MNSPWLVALVFLNLAGFALIVYLLFRLSTELNRNLERLVASFQNLERRIEPLVENTDDLVRELRKDLDAVRGGILGLVSAMKVGAAVVSVLQAGVLDKIIGLFFSSGKKQKKPPEPTKAEKDEVEVK